MNGIKSDSHISILSYPGMETSKNTESVINYNQKASISSKKKVFWILGFFLALVVLALAVIIVINLSANYIFSNIYIDGVDVSHLTPEEALAAVTEEKNILLENKLNLVYEDITKEVSGKDIDAKYNVEAAVAQAYSIGRSGNIFSNNFNMIFSNFNKVDIPCEYSYNENKLKEIFSDITSNLPRLEQSVYLIENDNIIVKKGKAGTVVDSDEVEHTIISALENGSTNDILIPVKTVEPNLIDLEQIRKEIYQEPIDATYISEPFEIIPHQTGVDFAISMEDAQNLLAEGNDEFTIPLAYTYPEVTTDKIGTENFPDLLASFETTYIQSKQNRSSNLKVASNSINGVVIMPGEIFSYNKTLGPRTVEAGYKMAGIYSGGQEVQGLGGGICQISSNIYNVALMANLEIIERHNHQFLPGYVPAGMDATVVYGSLDFKFKNTRNYPIKLESWVDNGIASIKLYGVKEANEPEVSFETTILSTIYPQVVYQDSYSLAPGATQVQSYGQNGCKSITYKILKQDGEEISREVLSKDTYSSKKKVILQGVGAAEVETSVEPYTETHEEVSVEVSTETTSGTSTTSNEETSSNASTTDTGTFVENEPVTHNIFIDI